MGRAWRLASALSVVALGCSSAACTGAAAVLRVQSPRAEADRAPSSTRPATPLPIDRVVLVRGGEVAIRLEPDGSLISAECRLELDREGTLRAAEAAVLRLEPSGRIVDRDGRELFTLERGRLVRTATGAAAVLEGERVVFEGSPDLTLEVEREPGGDDRAVLMTVAALSVCGEAPRAR